MKRPSNKNSGSLRAVTPETTPIFPSSVYTFRDLDAVRAYYDAGQAPDMADVQAFMGDQSATAYLYRRNGHPNERPVEMQLADLEQAEDAALFSSGMGAISQACLALLKPGDHLIATRHLYGGTYAFFENILRPWGVNITYIDLDDMSALTGALHANTRMLYAETIANPLLQVLDLTAIGDFAKANGCLLLVDNTFATPLLVQPLTHGATLSIHSLTKYLNGHSDVIGGAVAGDAQTVAAVRKFAVTLGGTLGPFDAWLTERGLQTFHLRYPAQCANALQVARMLSEQPNVRRVFYPGLPSHPSHAIARGLLQHGFGAIVSFELSGGYNAANRFVGALEHIHFAPSLGGVHTTVSHPGLTSHRAYSSEERKQLGIEDGLIRLSVGCEPAAAIEADLRRALQTP